MDVTKVRQIREDMERAEARRLQPHFIASFFMEAFSYWAEPSTSVRRNVTRSSTFRPSSVTETVRSGAGFRTVSLRACHF